MNVWQIILFGRGDSRERIEEESKKWNLKNQNKIQSQSEYIVYFIYLFIFYSIIILASLFQMRDVILKIELNIIMND
jgi:hypothetical protein